MERIFNRLDATKMLPLVSRIADDMIETWRNVKHFGNILKLSRGTGAPEEVIRNISDKLNIYIKKIDQYVKEISDLGCSVIEISSGTIGWPTEYSGAKCLFSWRPGDKIISYISPVRSLKRIRIK